MQAAPLEPRPPRAGAATLAALALLCLHAVLAWLLRVPGLTTGQDDAAYLLLGRALRQLSYSDAWLIGTPIESRYPPLYPALLALIGAEPGPRVTTAVVASILLSVAALGVFWLLVRRALPGLALPALALAAVNPALVLAAGNVRSEPLFLLCSMLSLWWLLAPVPSSGSRVAAGGFAIAAALTRTIGIALLAAVLLHWLLQRRYRPAVRFALAAGVTFGSWMAWTVVAPTQIVGHSYVADALRAQPVANHPAALPGEAAAAMPAPAEPGRAPFAASDEHRGPSMPEAPPRADGDHAPPAVGEPGPPPGLVRTVVRRLTVNLPGYLARTIPRSLAMPMVPGMSVDNWGWLLVVVGFGLAGTLVLARSLPGAAAYLAFYLGILAVWPYLLGRFLVPVLPLLALALLAGARWFGERWSRRAAMAAPLLLTLVLAAAGLRQNLAGWQVLRGCDRASPYASPGCFDPVRLAFFEAVFDAAHRTPVDAVLLTPKAATVYTLIGRRGVNELEAARLGPEELRAFLERQGVRYVLLSHVHHDQWVIAGRLLPGCRSLDLVRDYGSALLLRTGPEAPAADACPALTRFASATW